MNLYHVTYFYLATGMEGRAEEFDYGEIVASSPQEAKYKAAKIRHSDMSDQDIDWVIGCLSAKKVG